MPGIVSLTVQPRTVRPPVVVLMAGLLGPVRVVRLAELVTAPDDRDAAPADDERVGEPQRPGGEVDLGVALRRGEAEGTTDHVFDGDLEANVPFLGRRIEAAVAPQISDVVRLEEQVAREWLAADAG